MAVAWLFALQMIIGAVAILAPLSSSSADQTTGFTICLHDGASADQPAAPAPSVPCDHCLLCFSGGHGADAALPVTALPSVVVYFSRLRWAPAGVQFRDPPVLEGARPRGPPVLA